jgi:hypothetical protein
MAAHKVNNNKMMRYIDLFMRFKLDLVCATKNIPRIPVDSQLWRILTYPKKMKGDVI